MNKSHVKNEIFCLGNHCVRWYKLIYYIYTNLKGERHSSIISVISFIVYSIFFFFFFWWGIRQTFIQQAEIGAQQRKEIIEAETSQISSRIRCSTQLGLTPFQIWVKPDSLAAFASSWATLLPSLFRCWNVHQLKEAEQLLMSWKMRPISPSTSPWLRA